MIGGGVVRVRRFLGRAARPIDEAAWLLWRNRLSRWTLGVAAVLALQTALVHSPGYVIGALYHERRVINLEIQSRPLAEQARLLKRLCLAEALFQQGGRDPYAISGAQACSDRAEKQVKNGSQ